MPEVESSRTLGEPLVGGAESTHPALEALSHPFRPLLPLGMRHGRRHEQLEDAGAQAGSYGSAALLRGNYAYGWPKLVRIVFQDVVLRCLREAIAAIVGRRGPARKPTLLMAVLGRFP